LAKLFLGSKTLYYDVEPFLFYVMTENDAFGCHFVGYFSKEKRPSSLNNVSCILVLPIHMRKGYGQYLIEFSYLLTRVEKKTGSPEKPLSDMGLVSYRKYWRLVLCQELLNQKAPISITAISERTGMTADDIVSALEGLRALVRDPVTKSYALRLDHAYFKSYIEKCNANDNPKINPECLVWTPYVMGRLGQYEEGPALQTVQQREEVDKDPDVGHEEGVQQMVKASGKNGLSKGNPAGAEGNAEPSTPVLLAEESLNGDSPVPDTPRGNGSTGGIAGSQPSTENGHIPPTRYEIFPPIPGMPAAKRRPGRPFGSRRRPATPHRTRSTPLAIATAPVSKTQLSPSKNGSGKASPSLNGQITPGGSVTLRRTRSRLGESVLSGPVGDEMTEGGAVKAVNGYHTRSRSGTGSPKHANGKGKGKPVGNEEGTDEDEDGESDDPDADGEMDIDAEGEYDDGTDIVMRNA
jgi:histone acetyltransferase SAS3